MEGDKRQADRGQGQGGRTGPWVSRGGLGSLGHGEQARVTLGNVTGQLRLWEGLLCPEGTAGLKGTGLTILYHLSLSPGGAGEAPSACPGILPGCTALGCWVGDLGPGWDYRLEPHHFVKGFLYLWGPGPSPRTLGDGFRVSALGSSTQGRQCGLPMS
jgi:hypothetical protein